MQASEKGMEVTTGMRWNWVLVGLAAIFVVVLAFAWLDGGREPLREIEQSVALPDLPR